MSGAWMAAVVGTILLAEPRPTPLTGITPLLAAPAMVKVQGLVEVQETACVHGGIEPVQQELLPDLLDASACGWVRYHDTGIDGIIRYVAPTEEPPLVDPGLVDPGPVDPQLVEEPEILPR